MGGAVLGARVAMDLPLRSVDAELSGQRGVYREEER